MKRLFVSIAIITATVSAKAQEVRVTEPEFINSYCILTSDTTYGVLPKESGIIGKHESKAKKGLKLLGKLEDVAGAAGMIGIGTSSSMSGVMTGAKVMTTASGVGRAADAASVLAGSAGMDIIFNGGHSAYTLNVDGRDVRLLIKGESNETDPMDCYRIVRFNSSKKERRIQWMEFEPALLGTEDAQKAGYVQFEGHKYGEQSYLLTIPASEMASGEYGIFYMSIITATVIPVGTFSIN